MCEGGANDLFECADGFRFSVAVGATLYCSPRQEEAPVYTAVEVATSKAHGDGDVLNIQLVPAVGRRKATLQRGDELRVRGVGHLV